MLHFDKLSVLSLPKEPAAFDPTSKKEIWGGRSINHCLFIKSGLGGTGCLKERWPVMVSIGFPSMRI